MNERSIQKALFNLFYSHKFKFTNTYFFNNESDFLSFLPNGYCYECEIKISRSDFKADFKKEKHTIHKGNEIGSNLYLRKTGDHLERNVSFQFMRDFPELIVSREHYGFRSNIDGIREINIDYHAHISSGIEFMKHSNKLLPNKFFYVVPNGLIAKHEVPDYAGLIYVDELGRCTKIKDAKFLHKDCLDVTKLFHKVYLSYERELMQKLK